MDILERLKIIAETTSADWPTASIDWEYKEAVKEIERLRKIEARMKGLRELCGYVQDGSDTTVSISQDDATRSFILRCGERRWWHADSFVGVIDAAIADA